MALVDALHALARQLDATTRALHRLAAAPAPGSGNGKRASDADADRHLSEAVNRGQMEEFLRSLREKL